MPAGADVRTLLDAQWNAAIITEPSYKDGKLEESTLVPGTLYVWDEECDPRQINWKYGVEITEVYIFICSVNATNLALYESEIKRILCAASSTNFYHIKSIGPIDDGFQDSRANRLLVFNHITIRSYT